MHVRNSWIAFIAAISLAGVAAPAQANLVTDPGFEGCTTSGHAPPGWSASPVDAFCAHNWHSGNWDTDFTTSGTLSQTIATIAGHNYDFSFWLWPPGPTTNSFQASFGGTTVLSLTNDPAVVYKFEDFTVTATAASTLIAFSASTDNNSWSLDDVSVEDLGVAAVPEPSSLALLGTGLFGLWRARRRKCRA